MLSWFQKVIRNYFGFSQKETKGTVALSFLLLILVFVPFLQTTFYSTVPLQTSDIYLQDSLAAFISANLSTKEPALPDLEFYPFDPNKISKEDWLKLGLKEKVAERIENYKSKGGKFRRKEDLLRVYDFPQDLYEALEPYIQIENKQYTYKYKKPYENKYQAKTDTPKSSKKWIKKEKKEISKFDLNTADTAQLKRLRGIGEKRALNIIKYREKLGGFAQINQVEEIWGLDSVAIKSLKSFTYITPNSWRKITINTANIDDLKTHPYIGYKIANILINYRLQHGKYNSEADLRKVKALEETLLQKILPYLSFE
ncbi:MAG: helix-hairpin-helix domain-containing protein [Raineya sp.]